MSIATILQQQRLADVILARNTTTARSTAVHAATGEPTMETTSAPVAQATTQAVPVPAIPTPVSPVPTGSAEPHHNGFVSFLKHSEAVAHKVLAFLASPKNEKIVEAFEETGAVAASIGVPSIAPQVQAGLKIAELFTRHIFAAQALGAAAAATAPADDTNLQKAAVVIQAVTPEALQTASDAGLTLDIPTANDALVKFWNAIGAGAALVAAVKTSSQPVQQ